MMDNRGRDEEGMTLRRGTIGRVSSTSFIFYGTGREDGLVLVKWKHASCCRGAIFVTLSPSEILSVLASLQKVSIFRSEVCW